MYKTYIKQKSMMILQKSKTKKPPETDTNSMLCIIILQKKSIYSLGSTSLNNTNSKIKQHDNNMKKYTKLYQ